MALGDELSNINFESMIGGPLNAVIKAQAQSAITSTDFIKSVGFSDNDEPVMVSFRYTKLVEDENGGEPQPQNYQLTVPILTMLPIPFIRIEKTTIDFNAKITSVQESSTTSERNFSASLEAKARWGWGSAKLNASYSSQKKVSSSSQTERTYSMKVHVYATQDELPAGTDRLLGILENTIREVPA